MKHYQIWCVLPDVQHRLTDDVDPKLAVTHLHYWEQRLHVQQVIVDIPEAKEEEKYMTPEIKTKEFTEIGRSEQEKAYLLSVGLLCNACQRGKMHYEKDASLWWCDECLDVVDISMPESAAYTAPAGRPTVEILQKKIPMITVTFDRKNRVASIIEAYIESSVDIEYSMITTPGQTSFNDVTITGNPAHVDLAFTALVMQMQNVPDENIQLA